MSFNLNDAKNAIGNLAKGFEKGGGLLSGIDLPLDQLFSDSFVSKNSVFKTAKEFLAKLPNPETSDKNTLNGFVTKNTNFDSFDGLIKAAKDFYAKHIGSK
ncbi:MAG: hypothetical protein ACOYCB_09475 [Fastidiosipilaceae bacterium]|jgi:hypothetical protein|nr:hypothetical protein [Clostridiaceae bacterium]